MLIQSIYLGINAVIYLILGIWCAIAPAKTSKSVGYDLVGNQGTAEFVAVYGGLEFALGIFFAIATFHPPFREPGLAFGGILYAGLVTFRIFSMATNGAAIGGGWNFFGLEIVFLLGGIYCWFLAER